MKRLLAPLLVALLGAVLFTGLITVDFYRSLDSRFYDLLLRLKPPIDEDESILLVEVDDPTITEINMYPLGRDIFADGLILMKEFSPAWTMLDIEFVDRSPAGINLDYLDYEVPESIYATIDTLMEYNAQLVEGILSGSISRNDALDYLDDLIATSITDSETLYETIRHVAIDKDAYLGRAIAYLGDVTATLNMTEDYDQTVGEELRKDVEMYLTVDDSITLVDDPFDKAVDILPSIAPVTYSAAWAGFPKMHIDADGVRRRVDVLHEQGGHYYSHMGFGTWWVRQGKPPLTVTKNKVIAGDLEIPLDRDGKMLINWPKRLFDGTPLNGKASENFDPGAAGHRLSFLELWYHDILSADIDLLIEELESYGVSSDLTGDTAQPLSAFAYDLAAMKQDMLDAGDGSRAGEYGDYVDQYLLEAAAWVTGPALNEVLNQIEETLWLPDLTDQEIADYEYLLDRVPTVFDEIAWRVSDLQSIRSNLRERLTNATIVVGYTGTSTTDYGANPFEKKYMNMGIYGAVYNSLIQGEFLAEAPLWLTFLFVLLAGLGITFLGLIGSKRSGLNTAFGLAFIVLAIIAVGAVFILIGFYINVLPLLLVLVFTFVASQAGNFMAASKEKAFIQGAFGQIISPAVVREIEKNPEMLNISGQSRPITAMFTDIEKFSTISEHLGSSDRLFEFLQHYLTPMSDLILEENGTIDKYEGDAIIAFWNAPLDQEDHAHRACRAAMRMVRLEKEISEDLIKRGFLDDRLLAKLPHGRLFTRIGINTGTNNIGFIGTEKRKDYTALGDDMNLAARLEGVNKLYGTQVLISGVTEEIVHTSFITRRLDRVRVMGKDQPVPLYELSYSKEFPEDFTQVERECFNNYRDALDLFWAKKWNESEKLFKKVLAKLPDDGPTHVFVDRCEKYRKSPPPANWDGVYKMESK